MKTCLFALISKHLQGCPISLTIFRSAFYCFGVIIVLADKTESILKCSKQLPISSCIFRIVFETRTIDLINTRDYFNQFARYWIQEVGKTWTSWLFCRYSCISFPASKVSKDEWIINELLISIPLDNFSNEIFALLKIQQGQYPSLCHLLFWLKALQVTFVIFHLWWRVDYRVPLQAFRHFI